MGRRCSALQKFIDATNVAIVFQSRVRDITNADRIPFCHQNTTYITSDLT